MTHAHLGKLWPVLQRGAVLTMCSVLACGIWQPQSDAVAWEIEGPSARALGPGSRELSDTARAVLPAHGQVVSFEGTCDASGAIPLDEWRFAVADFFSPPGRDGVMILSDDGTRLVDGVPCKRLGEAARKGFRGIWLEPPPR